ncbi:unnamed protein product [Ixodes persulcatus]
MTIHFETFFTMLIHMCLPDVKYRGKHSLLTFPKLGNSANCTLSSPLYLTNTHV